MAACAITIVKTAVFEWFHFFHFVINLVSQGLVSGAFLKTFGDLGETFSDI